LQIEAICRVMNLQPPVLPELVKLAPDSNNVEGESSRVGPGYNTSCLDSNVGGEDGSEKELEMGSGDVVGIAALRGACEIVMGRARKRKREREK